jgi:hypothetical protein
MFFCLDGEHMARKSLSIIASPSEDSSCASRMAFSRVRRSRIPLCAPLPMCGLTIIAWFGKSAFCKKIPKSFFKVVVVKAVI